MEQFIVMTSRHCSWDLKYLSKDYNVPACTIAVSVFATLVTYHDDEILHFFFSLLKTFDMVTFFFFLNKNNWRNGVGIIY